LSKLFDTRCSLHQTPDRRQDCYRRGRSRAAPIAGAHLADCPLMRVRQPDFGSIKCNLLAKSGVGKVASFAPSLAHSFVIRRLGPLDTQILLPSKSTAIGKGAPRQGGKLLSALWLYLPFQVLRSRPSNVLVGRNLPEMHISSRKSAALTFTLFPDLAFHAPDSGAEVPA